jgi:hypothetical protein
MISRITQKGVIREANRLRQDIALAEEADLVPGDPQAEGDSPGSGDGNGSETSIPLSYFQVVSPTPILGDPFPLNCLPHTIRSYIEDTASANNLDRTGIAVPFLSVLGACIGNTRALKAKERMRFPPNLWTGTVGESGTGKSHALKIATRILERIQARKHASWHDASERYERELEVWESSKPKDRGEKPQRPFYECYFTNDATLEALAQLAYENQRGILLIRDELSGWFRSFDQYRQGRGGDLAHYLTMFDGGSIAINRKDREHPVIYIPRALVSITGTVQPGVLSQLLTAENIENGLAGRFLFGCIEDRERIWSDSDCDPRTEDALERTIGRLLSLEFGLDRDKKQIPQDRVLNGPARAVWRNFFTDHEKERRSHSSADLRAAWAKHEGACLRLALILHETELADNVGSHPDEINADTLDKAIEIIQWFGNQTRRIYRNLSDSGYSENEKVYRIVRACGGSISCRELMQACSKYRRSVLLAEDALNELVKCRAGTWEVVGPGPQGGRPVRRFYLMDGLVTQPRKHSVN